MFISVQKCEVKLESGVRKIIMRAIFSDSLYKNRVLGWSKVEVVLSYGS
jgi:hypothetical protein